MNHFLPTKTSAFFKIFMALLFVCNSLSGQITTNIEIASADSTVINALQINKLNQEIDRLSRELFILDQNVRINSTRVNKLVGASTQYNQSQWETMKSNIVNSIGIYKTLNSDIIIFKSSLRNTLYQDYIKSLGSINGGPLGISFDEVIKETILESGIFENEKKLKRFLNVAQRIINSPIVASIPFASNAVNISNSIMSVVYSNSVDDKNVEKEKLKTFEQEIDKYTSYYVKLDEARLSNNVSTNDRLTLLTKLQSELLNKAKIESLTFNIAIPEKSQEQNFNQYSNMIYLQFFNESIVDDYLTSIENKYKVNGVIEYPRLLRNEIALKTYNNNLDKLVKLIDQFKFYHLSNETIENEYSDKIIKALDVAKKNNIIEPGKDEDNREISSNERYENIISALEEKKQSWLITLTDALSLQELKNQEDQIDSKFIIY